MKTKKAKKTVVLLILALLLGACRSCFPAEAAGAKLSKKSMKIQKGGSALLKVRNTAKRATWTVKSGRKVVRLKAKKKTSVKVKALKTGKAKIQCRVGNKKLVCKVQVTAKKTVEKTPEKSKETPGQTPETTPVAAPTMLPSETPEPTKTPDGKETPSPYLMILNGCSSYDILNEKGESVKDSEMKCPIPPGSIDFIGYWLPLGNYTLKMNSEGAEGAMAVFNEEVSVSYQFSAQTSIQINLISSSHIETAFEFDDALPHDCFVKTLDKNENRIEKQIEAKKIIAVGEVDKSSVVKVE